MKNFIFLLIALSVLQVSIAQKAIQFGLQTGPTVSTLTTSLNLNNSVSLAIPPLNEFEKIANFHAGFWFEKQLNPTIALRWEVQRSPGGAKVYDALENRTKRYKFFYLSSPLLLKLAPFQRKFRFPIQMETGLIANFFLFDYGEEIIFGTINKWEFSSLFGLSRNIDDRWSVSIRYLRGIRSFSEYEAGGIRINWTNQMYVLSFSRALLSINSKLPPVTASKTYNE